MADDMPTTVLGAFSSAVAVLAGAIAYLWRRSDSRQQETESRLTAKLDACEEQHAKAQTDMRDVCVRLANLEGRQAERDVISEKISTMGEEIVSAIRELNSEGTTDA